jgi:hypothetical protein
MKIHVIYRPKSEHGTMVENYVREFAARRAIQIEPINIDTRDGAAEAILYGVMSYPAILILKDDGGLLTSWEGSQLPLMDEVAAYARS